MEKEIVQLLKNGKSSDLDFFPDLKNVEYISQTICAMLNSKGGEIYFGVKENGKIIGCDTKIITKNLENLLKNNISPETKIEIETSIVNFKPLVKITLQVAKNVVYKATSFDKKSVFCYRFEGQNIVNNKIIERITLLKLKPIEKSESLDNFQSEILNLLQKNSKLTLSSLYNFCKFDKKIVEENLSLLIHWGKVDFSIEENIIYYSTN